MILAWAVIAGFVAGLARSIHGKRRYTVPSLRYPWIILVAFLPQLFAFRLPSTRSVFPDEFVPYVLLGSQAILLVFVVLNLRAPGFWAIGIGLAANILVIALNHGMMPISPETVTRLLGPDAPPGLWSVGERFGVGKDIVLPKGATNLWILSDIFLLSIQDIYGVAFSIGDILIAIGAIRLLWLQGGPEQVNKE